MISLYKLIFIHQRSVRIVASHLCHLTEPVPHQGSCNDELVPIGMKTCFIAFVLIQSNFNDSNTFGTMKISLRQG